MVSPAHAILQQFDWATQEIKKDPEQLPVWIPILNQFAPSLLVECEAAIELSERLVRTWLEKFMFNGEKDAKAKAKRIAAYLADYDQRLSHGRPIKRDELRKRGVKVLNLEEDATLRERVWDAYNAVVATFIGTSAYKIFENHHGDCIARLAMQLALPFGIIQQPPPQPTQPTL